MLVVGDTCIWSFVPEDYAGMSYLAAGIASSHVLKGLCLCACFGNVSDPLRQLCRVTVQQLRSWCPLCHQRCLCFGRTWKQLRCGKGWRDLVWECGGVPVVVSLSKAAVQDARGVSVAVSCEK